VLKAVSTGFESTESNVNSLHFKPPNDDVSDARGEKGREIPF